MALPSIQARSARRSQQLFVRKVPADRQLPIYTRQNYAVEMTAKRRMLSTLFDNPVFRAVIRAANERADINTLNVKKILYWAKMGLGDGVMQTPVIEQLHQRFPEAAIYAVVSERTREIMESNPCLTGTIKKGRGLFWLDPVIFWARVAFKRFDLSVMDTSGSTVRSRLLSFFAGVKYRVGEVGCDDLLAFLNNENTKMPICYHRVLKNLSVITGTSLSDIGEEVVGEIETSLNISEEQNAAADKFLLGIEGSRNDYYIGFHMGSGAGSAEFKRWPSDHFISLGKMMTARYPNVRPFIFRGPNENGEVDRFASLVPGAIIVEGFGIMETAAIIKRCALMISNDSGLAHVSAAVRTPVITIFGPTDPYDVAPWGYQHLAVRHEMPCSNCYEKQEFHKACNDKVPCLTELMPEEVMDFIEKNVQEGKLPDMKQRE